MKRTVVTVSAVVVLLAVIAAVAILPRLKPGQSAPVECAPLTIVIDRANTVYGLKEDNIFAYVDLAEMAPVLSCHTDTEIQDALLPALTASVDQWWQEPRLSKAQSAQVHIISILDKDEYARANFNAAQTHGKVDFTREGGKATPQPASLTFDNMRAKLEQK